MEVHGYINHEMGNLLAASGWPYEHRVQRNKRHHPSPPREPPLKMGNHMAATGWQNEHPNKRNKMHHPPPQPPLKMGYFLAATGWQKEQPIEIIKMPPPPPQPPLKVAASRWQYEHPIERIKMPPPPPQPPLKMVAELISIPKEDSDYPHGDDASFISADKQSIGVADGVGGWRKSGIDSGEYARQLMSLIQKNHNENNLYNIKKSPKRVLEEAYSKTTAKGSSTACIVSFSGWDGVLRAANVGDSGFLVIRNGVVVYRSPKQQRSYNCPYQLGPTKDDPSVAEEIEFCGVEKGDLVLLGTDGVLDNVHEDEMLEILDMPCLNDDLWEMALCVAETAFYNSLDKGADTPYANAARRAGKKHKGGKKDDITLVIARVIE